LKTFSAHSLECCKPVFYDIINLHTRKIFFFKKTSFSDLDDIFFNPQILEVSFANIMSSSENKEISARDLQILDLLFDQSKSEDLVKNCTQPIHDDIDIKDDEEEITEQITSSKKYEIEGVVLAEAAKFEEALEKFNKAIEIAPNRPSPYNNRAQLYRFLKNDDSK